MVIRVLPIEIINQIAAGEIIYSPSSVIKELIENSIDAGATKICVNVEESGLQSISVSDNGSGMDKKNLKIAVLQHTTSKIFSLNDLENINSLGFRGEALSSITSISRTTLISCTKKNEEAWSLYTEGYNNPLIFKPTSHPVGTSVIVCDLFYNVPVRRKFIKNVKNEFLKIHEIVRCMVLSKNNIDIKLKHNSKLIKHYTKIDDTSQEKSRLQNVFGFDFLKKLIPIDLRNNFMRVHGWISLSEKSSFYNNKKYYYVNNRIVNNHLIRHAIHQGIKEIFNKNVSYASIFYVFISNNQIDVNIHPTKSEIKFHQSRLVHGFIYQAIIYAFKKNNKKNEIIKSVDWVLENSKISGENYFEKKEEKKNIVFKKTCLENISKDSEIIQGARKEMYFFKKNVLFNNFYKCFGYLLSLIYNCYLMVENIKGFALVSLPMAERLVFVSNTKHIINNKIKLFILPKIFKVQIISVEYDSIINNKDILLKFGLNFFISSHFFCLKSIPLILKKQNWKKLFLCFLTYIFLKKTITYEELLKWFALNISISKTKWDNFKIMKVLSDMEKFCPIFIEFPPSELLQPINFDKKIRFLKI
ncbi:DNA mismatch repair endonuclease MutL [Buchnera aphidicola (Pemphigus obesinymphae)]|uniref:DNA mismatch repair endonuclease MutL n=1 Tax=Buchnera aphidicola TaxID=9 RepID=UPI002238DF0E|nr:DNA mismatch repair endonuclease MutL [Buchnera aphidicola]MCW5196790.1 DNA mismatch repair endonuclease MutL [Buchnera aphidicola (Pemphigus obesinymphae)]